MALKYTYEGIEFALVIVIKTGEISFRIEVSKLFLCDKKIKYKNNFICFRTVKSVLIMILKKHYKSIRLSILTRVLKNSSKIWWYPIKEKKVNLIFVYYRLINENEFDHTVDMITNEMLIELNNFKLKSTGEDDSSGVDAFDILAEVIQEDKPRIISGQEPEVLKIKDYLKKETDG